MDLNKNDIVRATIDGYSSEGQGVAHVDGRAVFVRRALPGEVVDAQILKVSSGAVYAKVESLLEASPQRTTPACPYFGKCGGCDFMHMSYAEELRAKHARVSDALQRLGKIDITLPPVVPSPATEGYRNKAIFAVRGGSIGFYRERSHDIIELERCLIQSDAANGVLGAVREWLQNEAPGGGGLRYIFVREGQGVQIVLVSHNRDITKLSALLSSLRERIANITSILQNTNNTDGNTVLHGKIRVLSGDDFLEDTLCGNQFRLSAKSFYQVNRAQAENLYSEALRLAALTPSDTALDLYCGAGTITLALARAAGLVYGVETVADAVNNATINAVLNGITNAKFLLGDAGEAAAILGSQGIEPTVVVVDPPRKGLLPHTAAIIADLRPSRVVYVSCDPATLARDLNIFDRHGYKTKQATAFDMFPRCAHIETVTLLESV